MIKQRNIALCIVFSIITFGIYALYWFVCLTNDANQESGQTDATSGGVALLLTIVTCNIYGWFWAYKMGEKIDAIKTKNGQSAGNSSILFLLLQLCGLGIVSYAIMQDTIKQLRHLIRPSSGIWTWNYCICAYAGHCKQICRGYTSDEYRIWSADLQSAAIWSAGI